MSSFNPRDFLPKLHSHNVSSNQSMRSHTSKLSLRNSKLGLSKRPSSVLNHTLAGTQQAQVGNAPASTTSTAANNFAAPKISSKAAVAGSSKDANENEVSPPARQQSPKQPPTKAARLSTSATQTPPRHLKIPFSSLDEDDDKELWPSASWVTPKKNKRKSPGKRTGPSPAKSSRSSLLTEFDSSKGFCPICQVPLACIKITKFAHTARCQVCDDGPECEDKEDCLNTSWMHFRDNKHTFLAKSRSMEDASSDNQSVLEVEPMPQDTSANLHRLETVLESASEVTSPVYVSPAKDNPFLDSDSEDDIFKDYDKSKNGPEKINDTNQEKNQRSEEEEEEIVEPQQEEEEPEEEEEREEEEELEEEVVDPEHDFVEPSAGQPEKAREIVPCLVGACDINKQSVTVSVNGEAVKFCTSDNNGWELVEKTEGHPSITHSQCVCKKNLQISIQPPMSAEATTDQASAKKQWSNLMGRMQGASTSKASSVSSKAPSVSSMSSVQSDVSELGKNIKCPDFKRIRGTRFVVDAFTYGMIHNINFYFLSHFHYDHYRGLSKHFSGNIYCSKITGKLVKQMYKLRDSQIRILPMNEMIVVDGVKVTALDANHCPGAVMLLFQLLDGTNIVHTGDFRFCPAMESYTAFWNLDIDILHLDTTYCNPKYNFPPQSEILAIVGTLAEDSYILEEDCLFVCGSYTIGKEKVFLEIAKTLELKFWAETSKRRILDNLDDALIEKYVTAKKEDAKIHVVPNGKINIKGLQVYKKTLKRQPSKIVAFRPTGWTHNENSEEVFGTQEVGNITIYSVPYSEHSSYSELKRLVQFLKPRIVKPHVKPEGVSWAQVNDKCKHWIKEASKEKSTESKF